MANHKKYQQEVSRVVARKEETINDNKRLPIVRSIFSIRNKFVILDSDLARFYETTTTRINQYRDRNQEKFTSDYSFQLSNEEFKILRSQNAISKSQHGGTRYNPWVYTEYGVALMSMGLKSRRAVELSHIIIDTFISLRRGTLPNERVIIGPKASKQRRKMLETMYKQINKLLDTEIPSSSGTTLRKEIGSIATHALHNIKEVLDSPGKRNEKISAEITKILAEAEKVYAETRKINEESYSIALSNLQKRLEIMSDYRTMVMQLERDEWLDVFDNSFNPTKTKSLIAREENYMKNKLITR